MIKIQYEDGLGLVDASFESYEEYSKFRAEVLEKRQKEKNEEMVREEEEAKKRAEDVERCWSCLKDDARRLVRKAKSYGVTPAGFVEMIRAAIYDAADDRCNPGSVAIEEISDALAREAVPLSDLVGDRKEDK